MSNRGRPRFTQSDSEKKKRINEQKQKYKRDNREKIREGERALALSSTHAETRRIRNQNANARRKERRQNMLLGSLESVENVSCLDLGEMEVECQHCRALAFRNEFGRSRNNCCHKGKITINDLQPYPQELLNLVFGTDETSKHFRENIRIYNNVFAFASFNCVSSEIKGRGPYCMRVLGPATTKATTSLISRSNPRYGQVYIYDDNETVKHRMTEYTRKDVLLLLQRVLQSNPYAQKYRKLYDVYSKTGEDTVSLNFVSYSMDDKRRYNVPGCHTIAAIIVSKDGCLPDAIDVKVFPKSEIECNFISTTSHHSDPMLFPILFPSGEHGWSYSMKSRLNKNISPLQYYSSRLSIRKHQFNPVLCAGRLTQQYIINCYLTVEAQRLKFLRFNQQNLRTECYQGLMDHMKDCAANNADNVRAGNVLILPSSFPGSPRSMQELYHDAMVLCRKVGRPDLFVTMTCNPKWPEITRYLKTLPPGISANDIPHFVCRLFFQKVTHLIKDMECVFGGIRSYVYTIEFQKRGLPHMHLLVTLKDKLLTSDDVDKFILAEIPNQQNYPSLWYKVVKHMLHGPHTAATPCYDEKSKVCTKKFPKPFVDATEMKTSGFPLYRRRDNRSESNTYHGKTQGRIVSVDNSMVVPYNPYLLMKYDCHINVEYCASIMGIKYIHKYIHKGHDRARIEITSTSENNQLLVYDEIKDFVDTRYLSASEGAWRLLELPLHGRSHAVERLPLHLPDMNRIVFHEGKESEALNQNKHSKLTAYFELNKLDTFARGLKYEDIPSFYRWDNTQKNWKKRTNSYSVVSRIVSISPRQIELFHLKLLLRKISGSTTFLSLRTKDGIVYNSFAEAALAYGFVTTENEITDVMMDAAATLMPHQLRKFFVYLLIGSSEVDGKHLWNRFKREMSEDLTESKALSIITLMLEAENIDVSNYGLPTIECDNESFVAAEIDIAKHGATYLRMYNLLNPEQRAATDAILSALHGNGDNNCFYVDGPAGSGKTFLYECVIHYLISNKMKVMTIAWTGIAAILLPFGKTAHKSFQLPINVQQQSTLYWSKKTKHILKDINVFIWDEASMIPLAALETIDIALRDICFSPKPFGGKVFLLGGDFRQTLPVIKRAGRSQILQSTIKSSSLWINFVCFSLSKNMRQNEDSDVFSKWLLSIGNGESDFVTIPENLISNDLVTEMFVNIEDTERVSGQAILCPRNDDVAHINDRVLDLLPGDLVISEGIDTVRLKGCDGTENYCESMYPLDYINSLTPSGFPPQKLLLKRGAIVMLIRNLSVSDGLCNGTRLVVKSIQKRYLECEVITGDKSGNVVFLPKIKLDSSSDNDLPFTLYRHQFPVRLSFAMTINKSQGQTFSRIGLYLTDHHSIFTHGQLYVALSRCRSFDGIKVQLPKESNNIVQNIVYKEIL